VKLIIDYTVTYSTSRNNYIFFNY